MEVNHKYLVIPIFTYTESIIRHLSSNSDVYCSVIVVSVVYLQCVKMSFVKFEGTESNAFVMRGSYHIYFMTEIILPKQSAIS